MLIILNFPLISVHTDRVTSGIQRFSQFNQKVEITDYLLSGTLNYYIHSPVAHHSALQFIYFYLCMLLNIGSMFYILRFHVTKIRIYILVVINLKSFYSQKNVLDNFDMQREYNLYLIMEFYQHIKSELIFCILHAELFHMIYIRTNLSK